MSESIKQLDQALQAFESAWESGVVDDFAAAIPKEARNNTDLLIDLACIDLQNRIQSDLETRVESYTTLFPQLAKDDLVLLELIRTEYSFHPERDSLDVQSYCQRFPHLSRQIEMMFQLEFQQTVVEHNPRSVQGWCCTYCNADAKNRSSCGTKCTRCSQPISIGRYELIERVGQGAFGYVYRARDPKLDREVAIKVPRPSRFLTPEECERFLRESRNAAQLDHSGIVKVFDTGRNDGVPYIVSEFIQGQPLSSWLPEREFDFRESASLMVNIASAVAHAHERGVIHRDLKPSNIMTGEDEVDLQPRVMDFGLARRYQKDTDVTIEGQAIGTPAYMSPEQASGDLAMVGPRSDVYSLGVILYQLLCGELPFRGNVQRLIQQAIHDDPPSPSRFRNRIPRDLETICMKAISREPTGRYAGAKELGEELQRWLDGKPIQSRPVGAMGKSWRWCCRRPAVAALLATLAISIVAGLTGVAWQWQKAEAARMASEADLSDALESVDKVLGHLGSDTLDDIPQAKQLRAEVLNDALIFFERFRQRNPDDPRVEMQVASAHQQVARIQSALGNHEEADKAYKAATDAYSKVKDRAPNRKDWQKAAASAHSGYANFLLKQSRKREAYQHQEKCVAIRKQLHEENAESGENAAKYATAQADLGRALTDVNEIAAQFETAIEQLEELVSQKTAVGYKRDLARVLHNYAIRLGKTGKRAKAEQLRQRAVELMEKVVADDPLDESKRAAYANYCLQLVRTLRAEARVDTARIYQQKVVDAYRSLTEDFPATPRHRERFATALREVGSLAKAEKRTVEEIEARQEAVQQREVLAILFPSKSSYQRSLVTDLDYLAKALMAQDRNEEAELRLRQKLKLIRELSSGGSVRDKVYLVKAIRELASLIASSGAAAKVAEADELYSEADQIASEFDTEQVLSAELSTSRKLSILDAMIRLAKQDGDFESVENSYQAKIELVQGRLKSNPESMSQRNLLAVLWSKLGEARSKNDRKQEAIVDYRKTLRIYEELLADDPESSFYASQLLNHSSSLGVILQNTGNPEESIKVVRRALELAKRLHEEQENEAYRGLRVLLAYFLLAESSADSGDYQGAQTAYEEALAVIDVLHEQPETERLVAAVLNSAAWFLVTCPDETLRNPARALKLAQKAIATDPQMANRISTLAFALYETGNHVDAVKAFERSTRLDDSLSPLNTLMTACAHAKLGDMELAKQAYAKAIQMKAKYPFEKELFEMHKQKYKKLTRVAD